MRAAVAALTIAALVAASPLAARANDVTDQIAEAQAAYAKKDIATAIAALEAAASLLRQQRSDAWKGLLRRRPPAGPRRRRIPAPAAPRCSPAAPGCRANTRKGGDDVEISILAESPLIQAMSAVITNPLVASMAGRVAVIGGRRFTFITSDNAYVTLVADKVLVRVQGSSGLNDAALRPFVAALDFAAIEKLAR